MSNTSSAHLQSVIRSDWLHLTSREATRQVIHVHDAKANYKALNTIMHIEHQCTLSTRRTLLIWLVINARLKNISPIRQGSAPWWKETWHSRRETHNHPQTATRYSHSKSHRKPTWARALVRDDRKRCWVTDWIHTYIHTHRRPETTSDRLTILPFVTRKGAYYTDYCIHKECFAPLAALTRSLHYI